MNTAEQPRSPGREEGLVKRCGEPTGAEECHGASDATFNQCHAGGLSGWASNSVSPGDAEPASLRVQTDPPERCD